MIAERVSAPAVLQHLSHFCLPPLRTLTQHSMLQLARALQLALQRSAIAHQLGSRVVGTLAAAARAQSDYIEMVRECTQAAIHASAVAQEDGAVARSATAGASAALPVRTTSLLAQLAALLAGGNEPVPGLALATASTYELAAGGAGHGSAAADECGSLLALCAARQAAHAALAAAHAAEEAFADRVRFRPPNSVTYSVT